MLYKVDSSASMLLAYWCCSKGRPYVQPKCRHAFIFFKVMIGLFPPAAHDRTSGSYPCSDTHRIPFEGRVIYARNVLTAVKSGTCDDEVISYHCPLREILAAH